MENNKEDDIIAFEKMVNAKMILDGLNQNNQDEDYFNIVNQINSYLIQRCTHNIIEDEIDISETRSKTIYYCENCTITFERP